MVADGVAHLDVPEPAGGACPCARRACHCGMTRARAEQLAAAAPAAAPAAPPARAPAAGAEALAAMPRDVKALLVAGALVMVAGLGWLVFGPSPPPAAPPVLGYVEPARRRPPSAPRPRAALQAPLVEVSL